jgi:uncharacterized protein
VKQKLYRSHILSEVFPHMNRLLTLPFLLITLLVGTPAFSGDYKKGYDAYQSGDYATALREWTPLAEQGDARLQAKVGSMYSIGQGVPQDYKTALKWLRLAAWQGNDSAQTNLGIMYSQGQGVPQNKKTAVKWFRLAAEQGNAYAQYNLGYMTAYGAGVPQDSVYAHMWGNLAVTNGIKKGTQLMDMVASQMTLSELKKALDLARECVRKKYKGC